MGQDELQRRYGLLLTTEDIADLFRCKPESIRVQMCRGTGLGALLSQARLRIGKRNFYPAGAVANVLMQMETGEPV